jgi:hypothetical protein
VSLEAKSKKSPGSKVSAKAVVVSGIARQRDDYECDHALVVGPDFPTSSDETVVVEEIKADREHTGKPITLLRVSELARLVRLVPAKRVGLDGLQDLFQSCITLQQSKAWVDKIEKETSTVARYLQILEAIANEQREAKTNAVEFAALDVHLRAISKTPVPRADLIELCKALARMAPEFVAVTSGTVEIRTRPDKITAAIGAMIAQYPEAEREGIRI